MGRREWNWDLDWGPGCCGFQLKGDRHQVPKAVTAEIYRSGNKVELSSKGQQRLSASEAGRDVEMQDGSADREERAGDRIKGMPRYRAP